MSASRSRRSIPGREFLSRARSSRTATATSARLPSALAARETLDTIGKLFPLRNCSDHIFRNRSRPCLEYQIKRCLAPCVLPVAGGRLSRAGAPGDAAYRRQAAAADRRADASACRKNPTSLEFEDAARLRDQIQAIEKTLEKQRMVAHWGADQDVFGLYREGGFIEVQVLFVRQGKLTGNQSYSLRGPRVPRRRNPRARC